MAATGPQSPRSHLHATMNYLEGPRVEVESEEAIGRSVSDIPSQYKQWIAQMHDQVALTLASGEMLGVREDTRDQLEQILRDASIVLYDKEWEDVLQHVTSKIPNSFPKEKTRQVFIGAGGRGQSWDHPAKVNYRCSIAGCGKNTHRSLLSDGILRCRKHFHEQRAIIQQQGTSSSAGSASVQASSSRDGAPKRVKRRLLYPACGPLFGNEDTDDYASTLRAPSSLYKNSSSSSCVSDERCRATKRRCGRSSSAHKSASTKAAHDHRYWMQDAQQNKAVRSTDPTVNLLPCASDPYAHSDYGSHGFSPRSTRSNAGEPHRHLTRSNSDSPVEYPSTGAGTSAENDAYFSNYGGSRLDAVKDEIFHDPFTAPYSPPTEDNVEQMQDVRDFERNYAQPRVDRPNRFAPPPTPQHPALDMQGAPQGGTEDGTYGNDSDDPLVASNKLCPDLYEPGGDSPAPRTRRRGKVKIVLSDKKKREPAPPRKRLSYALVRREKARPKGTFHRAGATYCRHTLCREWTWKESSFCERHTLKCTIPNCDGLAVFEALSSDSHGPAGIRCRTHYRYCTLPDCEKPAAPILGYQSDPLVAFKAFCHAHLPWVSCRASNCAQRGTHSAPYGLGVNRVKMYCATHFAQFQCSMCGNLAVTRDRSKRPPVLYCDAHVPQQVMEWEAKRWQPCVVPKCKNTGIARRAVGDKLGPPGIRCKEHTNVCVVDGCWTRGHMKRPADEFGPAGMRCRKHGIRCNIPHCVRPAQQKQVADEFGPAGFRCKTHFRQCNIFGCERSGTFKMPLDKHGPSGYRCAVHRK